MEQWISWCKMHDPIIENKNKLEWNTYNAWSYTIYCTQSI